MGEEMTHAHVGAALMRKWNLSPVLQEMVAFHHEPRSAVHYPLEVSIVHISTAIANCIEPSWNRGHQHASQLHIDSFAWETTGLSPEVIEPVADQINMESFTVLDIIDPDSLMMF
jgi:HD-like signal output (HDOD) protein